MDYLATDVVVKILTSDVAVLPPGDTISEYPLSTCTSTAPTDCMGEPEVRARNQSEDLTGREILMIVLVRLFTLNFTQPIVFLLNLYIGLIYGLLYAWFRSFPIVFEEIHHFNFGHLGLGSLGILVAALLTIPPYYW